MLVRENEVKADFYIFILKATEASRKVEHEET